MKFNISAKLEYKVSTASTLILNIHALKTTYQTILHETLLVEPDIKFEELINVAGENRLIRLVVPSACQLKIAYTATVNNAWEICNYENREEMQVDAFEPGILPYLYPSRYCQSDKLYRLASHMFGDIDSPFLQVTALTNWIHENVLYLSGSTNGQTSAYDTVTEQAGVCRDFAHLGIALCRALTIPARYFTGYACRLKPADFHACFEAYLNGKWILFDATGRAPLNGMIKIASGQDASNTAVANIFGDAFCTKIDIDCTQAEENFTPYFYKEGDYEGLAYL